MATTTQTAIRDAMLDAAEAVTPTSLSHVKFRRHREEIGLRSFAAHRFGNQRPRRPREHEMEVGMLLRDSLESVGLRTAGAVMACSW